MRAGRAAEPASAAPGSPPTRAPKAATRLAHRIVREIRRRGLGPGDKLISEEKMVARYGFARGTLREALRFLELQGVLRIKTGPGGGPVVARPDARHLASGFALLLQFAGAPHRALIEARCTIEPGMAAWAARRADELDLEALRQCVGNLERFLDDPESFHRELRRFHDLVAVASGNPVFGYLMPALRWIGEGVAPTRLSEERRRAWRAHARVLRAIESGDAEAAAQQMARLMTGSLRSLERDHPEMLERPISWSDGGS